MPCWYTLTTEIPLRPDVPDTEDFQREVNALVEYVKDNGSIEVVRDDTGARLAVSIDGYFSIHGPTTIDEAIRKLGTFALKGAMVQSRVGDEDDIYFVGPDDAANRQAQIDFHLEAIREHVKALEIEEDPMYDDASTSVDDMVVNAIRALVEDRNTLVVGSYPDTQQLDVMWVVEGFVRQEALDLVADIQNLESVEDAAEIAVCPEEIANNDFRAAAFFTALDLFQCATHLLNEPDIRRKPARNTDQAA